MVSALVIIAEGAEEMEAVISIDILRRGQVNVTVAGLTGDSPIKCSRDVYLKPDVSLETAITKGPYDIVVLPGGMKGAENLAASSVVGSLLKEQADSGRTIGAICAAPAVVLVSHGVFKGKSVTCYPALKDRFTADYKFIDQKVVVDGKLITSQGPGTAFDFGLEIVKVLCGESVFQETAKAMLL